MRRWLSDKLAKWTLAAYPTPREWRQRWDPEGYMIVPRAWVKEECLEADREWKRARKRSA